MTANPFLLFVCTGNTCRSPMAAALWNAIGTKMVARSAGLSAWQGQSAHAYAQSAVVPWGGDLRNHQAQSVAGVAGTPVWVITMTHEQAEAVLRVRPEWQGRVAVLKALVGETGDIPDPLGRDRVAYDMLAQELLRLLQKLRDIIHTDDKAQ